MLRNPNPKIFVEVPDGTGRKIEYVFLVPQFSSKDTAYLSALTYKTPEDAYFKRNGGNIPLGDFACTMKDDVWTTSHAFAKTIFEGFEEVESVDYVPED